MVVMPALEAEFYLQLSYKRLGVVALLIIPTLGDTDKNRTPTAFRSTKLVHLVHSGPKMGKTG